MKLIERARSEPSPMSFLKECDVFMGFGFSDVLFDYS
jgi:hypothetical protein